MFTVLGFSCILTEHLSIKAVLYIKPTCHEVPEKNYLFKRQKSNWHEFFRENNKIIFFKGRIPVWILTLWSLDVNWSLTVNTWPFSISFDLGSFVRTRWVGFPQAKDCRARTSSLSGISVSCWISWNFITPTL